MVRVANPDKLTVYRHASFDEGEAIYFRASKGDQDDDAIENLTRIYVIKDIDPKEMEAVASRGDDVRGLIARHLEPEIVMSGKRATLLHMTHHWTLKVPTDYTVAEKDDQGNDVLNEDGTKKLVPHPLAGQDMPLDAEWIGRLQEVTEDAYWTMSRMWAADGRTEKQEATFSGDRVRISENRGGQSPKKRKDVPA